MRFRTAIIQIFRGERQFPPRFRTIFERNKIRISLTDGATQQEQIYSRSKQVKFSSIFFSIDFRRSKLGFHNWERYDPTPERSYARNQNFELRSIYFLTCVAFALEADVQHRNIDDWFARSGLSDRPSKNITDRNHISFIHFHVSRDIWLTEPRRYF